MESIQQYPLQKNNSFNVKAVCPTIYFPKAIAELEELPDVSETDFYILGEGSNTLFVDSVAPIIIKPEFKGVCISETSDSYLLHVGAGENWHQLVCSCVEKGIFGLENLALIPGSVGAAPVQNLGAYGAEFADFCTEVKWFEFSSQSVKTLNNSCCQFSYRNSIFKQTLYNKGIITEVVFEFPKKWQANLTYAGLRELDKSVTAKEVMDRIIDMRQAKLPDPTILPNAGSFFKNPIVDNNKFNQLKSVNPTMPFYPQSDGKIKLAAGWLIDQCGLKGYREGGVGLHEHQALVLVNYQSEYGADIVALAKHVQQIVLAKFDILISPEVRMITKCGEQAFADVFVSSECK